MLLCFTEIKLFRENFEANTYSYMFLVVEYASFLWFLIETVRVFVINFVFGQDRLRCTAYTYEVCPENSRIYRLKIFQFYLEAIQPCRLQSTPLYSVCTAAKVSSIFRSIPGKLF